MPFHEIHLEVICKNTSTQPYEKINQTVQNFCKERRKYDGLMEEFSQQNNIYILSNVDDIYVSSQKVTNGEKDVVFVESFHLSKEDYVEEFLDEANQNDICQSCRQLSLPNSRLHGLWNNLVYDTNVKEDLLSYISTLSLLSEHKVNMDIIVCNRIILLHGPPGTGKTTLCKALAQKFSIRHRSKFSEFLFVEINVHSLFSKWFSESGKLVMKLFQGIQELIEDGHMFVFVLLDEVESLTASRASVLSGAEPSDSLRAVNAVLTQLDILRSAPNVFFFATSNLREAIDVALLDRIDIQQFIDLPCLKSRYVILCECIEELSRSGILHEAMKFLPYEELAYLTSNDDQTDVWQPILKGTEGYSGRSLRKLPINVYALYVQNSSVTVLEFLKYLLSYVKEHKRK